MTRLDICTEQHLTYLDGLRQSGETNMLGAAKFLMKHCDEHLMERDAKKILLYWMDTFAERNPAL